MKPSRHVLVIASAAGVVAVLSGLVMAQTGTQPPNTAEDLWGSPLAPLIRTLFDAAIPVLIAWAAKRFSEKTGIDIEATHRDALHSAAMTGINCVLARRPSFNSTAGDKDPVIRDAPEWVVNSVPDALKYLRLDPNNSDDRKEISEPVESKLGALLNPAVIPPNTAAATARLAGRSEG